MGRMIGQIFMKDFGEWTKEEQEAFAETINYPVRKAAHATEYAVLGILVLVRCKYQKKWNRKRMILTAWGISTMYAATDEIHQLFVPGRACMVTDVMIDSAGALTGILFASALAAIIIGRNREQKHTEMRKQKMEIKLAKSAGFCFGVKRAVDMVYEQAQKREERLDAGEEQVPDIYTFGPVIHNEEVVKDLKKEE